MIQLSAKYLVLILGFAACSSNSSSGSPDAAGQLGPGASLKCDSSGKNAWETYGATAFVAVNESIFTNVTAEITANGTTNLGTPFTEVGTGTPAAASDDIATFKGKLAAFLVYAYGGPTSIMYTDGKTYQGVQDMTDAHTGFDITSAQFTYFVSNIVVPSLTGNGVPHGSGGSASPNDVTSCFAPVVTDATFMASIVGH
jgi:hypothetical protein